MVGGRLTDFALTNGATKFTLLLQFDMDSSVTYEGWTVFLYENERVCAGIQK